MLICAPAHRNPSRVPKKSKRPPKKATSKYRKPHVCAAPSPGSSSEQKAVRPCITNKKQGLGEAFLGFPATIDKDPNQDFFRGSQAGKSSLDLPGGLSQHTPHAQCPLLYGNDVDPLRTKEVFTPETLVVLQE